MPRSLKCEMLKTILENEYQEDHVTNLKNQHISITIVRNNIPIEIEPGKFLNINGNFDDEQKKNLIKVL